MLDLNELHSIDGLCEVIEKVKLLSLKSKMCFCLLKAVLVRCQLGTAKLILKPKCLHLMPE